MKKTMQNLSVIFLFLFSISLIIFLLAGKELWKTLSISFGVTSYHFLMRLLVGNMADKMLHNEVNYNKKWFAEKPFEKPLYEAIHVKKWKKYIPTYNTDSFDIKQHSIAEIMGAGCQAEIIHEIIMVCSFLPVVLIRWFQPGAVFVLTSFLAALFDSIFVILQRYNRPRLRRLLNAKQVSGIKSSEYAK